jgi:hypothetical protein
MAPGSLFELTTDSPAYPENFGQDPLTRLRAGALRWAQARRCAPPSPPKGARAVFFRLSEYFTGLLSK